MIHVFIIVSLDGCNEAHYHQSAIKIPAICFLFHFDTLHLFTRFALNDIILQIMK